MTGDEGSSAAQEPGSGSPVGDVKQKDVESGGCGACEGELTSVADASSLEEGDSQEVLQPDGRCGTELCRQPPDGVTETDIGATGGSAGSLSQCTRIHDEGASRHLHSPDPEVCARASPGEEVEPVQGVRLAMALDLPMLNELD